MRRKKYYLRNNTEDDPRRDPAHPGSYGGPAWHGPIIVKCAYSGLAVSSYRDDTRLVIRRDDIVAVRCTTHVGVFIAKQDLPTSRAILNTNPAVAFYRCAPEFRRDMGIRRLNRSQGYGIELKFKGDTIPMSWDEARVIPTWPSVEEWPHVSAAQFR